MLGALRSILNLVNVFYYACTVSCTMRAQLHYLRAQLHVCNTIQHITWQHILSYFNTLFYCDLCVIFKFKTSSFFNNTQKEPRLEAKTFCMHVMFKTDLTIHIFKIPSICECFNIQPHTYKYPITVVSKSNIT